MSAYAFRYRGDLLPNQSRETVQQNLARVFHAPPDSLDCIFNADAIFEVTDLEEDVAEAYERTFRVAGALGQISAVENTQTLTEGAGPQPVTPFDPNQSADYYVSSSVREDKTSTTSITIGEPTEIQTTGRKALQKIGVFICVLALLVYAIHVLRPPTETLKQHAERTESLAVGRHEHPKRILDPANMIYVQEQQEMQDYLNWSIDAMLTRRMRPDNIKLVTDTTFRALARYQAWRNFQHFLHLHKGEKLPQALTVTGEAQHHESFRTILARIDDSAPPQAQAVKQKWLDLHTETPSLVRRFSRTLESLLTQFQIKSMSAHNVAQDLPLTTLNSFDMAPLVTNVQQRVSAAAEGNIVTFNFEKPELANTPLHIAFYWNRVSRNTKWVYRRNLRIVSGDFPLEHIQGKFHILKGYMPNE